MNPIKIFVLYHQQSPLFRSDCFEPLQTGCALESSSLGILRDDTGDNISLKNPNYAELTGNYWVWKSYLPQHPEVEYVGFCHYRRFLDFARPPSKSGCAFADLKGFNSFAKSFSKRYNTQDILKRIVNYDIVLPGMSSFGESIKAAFGKVHPAVEFDRLEQIIKTIYPDFQAAMDDVVNDNMNYLCLNYVMRRELFESFMTWIFDVLDRLEKSSDWTKYHEYMNEKIAAYLAEVFFNVWLRHTCQKQPLKILERNGILLCPDDRIHWHDELTFHLKRCSTASKAIFDGTFISRIKRILKERRHARIMRKAHS